MQLLLTTTVPAIVAVLVVWLTSRFAAIRTHDDRVWGRKVDAYAAIFEALFEMQTFFSDHLDDYMRDRDVPPEKSQERYAAYSAARQRLRLVLAREAWLLSRAVQGEIDKLNKALTRHFDNWFDDMDDGCGAVIEAHKAITELVSDDLRRPRLLPLPLTRFRTSALASGGPPNS